MKIHKIFCLFVAVLLVCPMVWVSDLHAGDVLSCIMKYNATSIDAPWVCQIGEVGFSGKMRVYPPFESSGGYTFFKTVVGTETIMIITATATVLGWLLTRSRIPQIVAESILTVTDNPYLILFFLNILLLVNGCFMEVIAALVILTPILVPMVKTVGIDPVHFGVIMTLNLMIGLLTPPLGMGLYTVQKVAGISFERIAKAAFPFLLPLILVLLLVTYIPDISLFLAHMVLGSP